VHGTAGGLGPAEVLLQGRSRGGVGDAGGIGEVPHQGLGPHPDDVVQGTVVPEQGGAVLVQVQDGREARAVHAREIEERAVLPEREGVVGVVHGALLVAEEEQDAPGNLGPEAIAALRAGMGTGHGGLQGW